MMARLLDGPSVRLLDSFGGNDGVLLFEAAKAQGQEGVVAKQLSSTYTPGKRSRSWLKIKANRQQSCAVVGFTAPQGGREHFGSLALAVLDDGKLSYAGQVGSGFDGRTLGQVMKSFEAAGGEGTESAGAEGPGAGGRHLGPPRAGLRREVQRVDQGEGPAAAHLPAHAFRPHRRRLPPGAGLTPMAAFAEVEATLQSQGASADEAASVAEQAQAKFEDQLLRTVTLPASRQSRRQLLLPSRRHASQHRSSASTGATGVRPKRSIPIATISSSPASTGAADDSHRRGS